MFPKSETAVLEVQINKEKDDENARSNNRTRYL